MMRKFVVLIIILSFALISVACGRNSFVCPQTINAPRPTINHNQLSNHSTTPVPAPTPSLIEIRGRMVQVDKVVNGPLCNDSWSGKIYVDCGVQVAPWTEEEGPTFLQDCELSIEPGTVVYVAAHNNEAYYKGCSCHSGENPIE